MFSIPGVGVRTFVFVSFLARDAGEGMGERRPVTRGWRFWKLVWSWRNAIAELRVTDAGRGVSEMSSCVEVKTSYCLESRIGRIEIGATHMTSRVLVNGLMIR